MDYVNRTLNSNFKCQSYLQLLCHYNIFYRLIKEVVKSLKVWSD